MSVRAAQKGGIPSPRVFYGHRAALAHASRRSLPTPAPGPGKRHVSASVAAESQTRACGHISGVLGGFDAGKMCLPNAVNAFSSPLLKSDPPYRLSVATGASDLLHDRLPN